MVREVVREQVGRKRDEVADDHTIRFDDREENELELEVTSASIVAPVSALSAISALGHPRVLTEEIPLLRVRGQATGIRHRFCLVHVVTNCLQPTLHAISMISHRSPAVLTMI